MDYIEKYEISKYFQDIITNILIKKPEKPLQILNSYFESVANGTNVLLREYEYITSTKRNRAYFIYYFYESFKNTKKLLSVDMIYQFFKLISASFSYEVVEKSYYLVNHQNNRTQYLNKLKNEELSNISFEDFIKSFKIYFFFSDFFKNCKKSIDKVTDIFISSKKNNLQDSITTKNDENKIDYIETFFIKEVESLYNNDEFKYPRDLLISINSAIHKTVTILMKIEVFSILESEKISNFIENEFISNCVEDEYLMEYINKYIY
ncbi:hypothetical protein BCR36DRAFT_347178 [Piromyces finnis]|uniref:Centriolar satellite-associated tubulin polyglutamylase complex regulator 1 n=1 Tax=Piromyces finnis TaxID=1754191 RepID=A0A1Y1VHZ0_9FUNG|nr:hypothetical protein BCR36DRAFT_347178 [Piromyces finnis]|eukprot:ORX55391.1 hypothetical protein BCR36DRAFT_347178 [Piromyces finnis]